MNGGSQNRDRIVEKSAEGGVERDRTGGMCVKVVKPRDNGLGYTYICGQERHGCVLMVGLLSMHSSTRINILPTQISGGKNGLVVPNAAPACPQTFGKLLSKLGLRFSKMTKEASYSLIFRGSWEPRLGFLKRPARARDPNLTEIQGVRQREELNRNLLSNSPLSYPQAHPSPAAWLAQFHLDIG